MFVRTLSLSTYTNTRYSVLMEIWILKHLKEKLTKTFDLHSVCISGIPHAQSNGLKTFLLFPHSVHNSHFLLKNHLGFHILEAGTDLPIICFSKLKLLNILLPKTNKGEQLYLPNKTKRRNMSTRVLFMGHIWQRHQKHACL